MQKEEKIKLKKHEERAINDFVKSYYVLSTQESFEANNFGDVLSETIKIYYKKRETLNFKTYLDTYRFLKHALKYGKMKSNNLLFETDKNRVRAKQQYFKELKWDIEDLENGK